MATKKSTQPTPKASVKQYPANSEMIAVPHIAQRYKPAPAVDPYLRPETVITEVVSFYGVDLPPILRGAQPGQELDGKATDHQVKVMWASRQDIDRVLRAVESEHPELDIPLQLVRAFMCRLDSVRDHAIFMLAGTTGRINAGDTAGALENVAATRESLGYWHDAHRLSLR